MVSLDTTVGEYLILCRERGADQDGNCAAVVWAETEVGPSKSMREALDRLRKEAPAKIGMESSLFAFENMLDLLSVGVRIGFARIIAAHPSETIHALSWRRLSKVHTPTTIEDWLLRSAWHSSWRGRKYLPSWEDD